MPIIRADEPSSRVQIDTSFVEQPWKKQIVRELEVGRWPIRWRERATKKDGIFAGVAFVAPVELQKAWSLSSGYGDLGEKTPGVKSVKVVEQGPNRQLVEAEVDVLWLTLTLNFEVEQDPPRAMRFRLFNPEIGEYLGVCRFSEAEASSDGRTKDAGSATTMELSTWFKPVKPVPSGLVLLAQKQVMLRGARAFLESCTADDKADGKPSRP